MFRVVIYSFEQCEDIDSFDCRWIGSTVFKSDQRSSKPSMYSDVWSSGAINAFTARLHSVGRNRV